MQADWEEERRRHARTKHKEMEGGEKERRRKTRIRGGKEKALENDREKQ